MTQATIARLVSTGWKTELLGKIVEERRPISYGIVQTGPPVLNGVKCIRVTDLINGSIVSNDLITTSNSINNSYRRTQLRKNDLVMALRGKIGEVAIVDEELVGANLTRGVALIAPLPEFDPFFLRHLLSSGRVVEKLRKSMNGSALQELSIGVLRNISISFPENINEQKAIASILNSFELAHCKIQLLIAQKETRKKGLMQQLLTGKKRLSGFNMKWNFVTIGDVFQEIYDSNNGDKRNAILTISSKQGFVSQNQKFDRVIAGDSLSKYTLLRKNDFAYNKGNSKTYPMGCIHRLEAYESAVVPFVYICFRASGKIDSAFYKYWFIGKGLDRQLKRIITSGARGDGLLNVDSVDFFKLYIPLPDLEEQIAIAEVIGAADREIRILNAKLEKIREQKRGLMQVLLTGTKRLKEFRE